MASRSDSRWGVAAATVLVTGAMAAAGAVGWPTPGGTPSAAAAPALHAFGSCAEVDSWLAEQQETSGLLMYGLDDRAMPASGSAMPQAAAMPAAGTAMSSSAGSAAAESAVGAGVSGTNTQEAAVDEADAAKARDGLLYTVDPAGLRILDVSGATPAVVSTVALPAPDRSTTASSSASSSAPSLPAVAAYGTPELLLVGNRVIVFTGAWHQPMPSHNPTPPPTMELRTARATVIDIADRAAPKVVTSVDVPGETIAAREHAGVVRWVVTSQSRPGDLDCRRIAHPEEPSGAGVLAVRSLDPAAPGGPGGPWVSDATAVTASGEMVYASADRLYVATTSGGRWGPVVPAGGSTGAALPQPPAAKSGPHTWIHAFDTSSGPALRYVASGKVDGQLLNRWSMSERGGALRVATTRWHSRAATPGVLPPPTPVPAPVPVPATDAAVTILAERDGRLTQTGQVTGLGKGEQIKAVRWFDDLGVVVTFRQTDPLYVVDLADPARPAVRGDLKISGFSTYLHPIGDHRLLGVGTAATEEGRTTGAQVATFDIGDPGNPRRIDVAETPGAHVDQRLDPRAFAYLPAARAALVPGYWSANRSMEAVPFAIRGYVVGDDGRLRPAGTVPAPGMMTAHQVTIAPSRVAVIGPAWLGSAMGARVLLLDIGGGTLTQTGGLTLPG